MNSVMKICTTNGNRTLNKGVVSCLKTVCPIIIVCSLVFSDSTIRDKQSIDNGAGNAVSFDVALDYNCTSVYWKDGRFIIDDMLNSIRCIDEIAALDYGWNGNDADKFDAGLLNFIKEIVIGLPVQPLIFPTARDSIQLEYEKENGDYLEFEIYENKVIKLFLWKNDGTIRKEKLQDVNTISREVKHFYE